jgi:hypothetical protein
LLRSLLEKRKSSTLAPDGVQSFAQLETDIPTYNLDNLEIYFAYICRPVGSSPSTLKALLDSYCTPWYRRNRWESRKAQTAVLDYAVESILNMAQRTIIIQDNINHTKTTKTVKGSTWRLDERLPPLVVYIEGKS